MAMHSNFFTDSRHAVAMWIVGRSSDAVHLNPVESRTRCVSRIDVDTGDAVPDASKGVLAGACRG